MIEFFGVLFIIIVGTIGHFVYKWSNNNVILGYFFAVNESTWEHIKLALFPSFLWFIGQFIFYPLNNALFFAKAMSLLTIIILIPSFYYGYKFIFKKDCLIIDIGCFVISVIISQIVFNILINIDFTSNIFNIIGIIIFFIILTMLFLFTKFPLKNFFFEDPVTKTYGFQKNNEFII